MTIPIWRDNEEHFERTFEGICETGECAASYWLWGSKSFAPIAYMFIRQCANSHMLTRESPPRSYSTCAMKRFEENNLFAIPLNYPSGVPHVFIILCIKYAKNNEYYFTYI